MTNIVKHNTLKRLTGIILSVMLIFALALLAGCEGSGNPTPSVTPSPSVSVTDEEKRDLVISNGDFENVGDKKEDDKDPVSYPLTSVTSFNKSYDYNLSSSYKAPDESSSGASGIVDLSATFSEHEKIGLATTPGYCPAITDKTEELGTHALMIHNGKPTALRYTTATSVSLVAGAYAKISVWVYTTGLKDVNGTDAVAGSPVGANVTVSSTSAVTAAGSSVTYDSVSVKNINTLGTWKQVTLYLAGSQFQATTVYVTLGLGKGTSTLRTEYAEGYAFFDELLMEYVSRNDYLAATADVNRVDASLTGTQVAVDYANADVAAKATAINFGVNGENLISATSVQPPFPVQSATSIAPQDTAGKKGVISLTDAKGVDAAGFENFPFAAESDILMIQNAIATSYATYSLPYTISANTCKAISVFVKTSALVGPTGASVSLITIPETNEYTDVVFNTHANINTSTTDHSQEKNYFWDGWTQYTFFIRNNTANDMDVMLRYALGATDVNNLNALDYTKGWAAFTNATMYDITSAQYANASTSVSTNKKVDLYAGSYTTTFGGGFDTYYSNNNTFETEPAAPSSWKPVSGNCLAIGGTSEFYGENTVSGLVNSAYWNNYGLSLPLSDWHNSTTVGDNPLMIYNKQGASFGYVSANKTLAANTSYQISVRVKVVGDSAKAYFYLTDSNLKNENPYAVKVMNVPEHGTNPAANAEFKLAIGNTTGLNMSSTPELINLGDGWMTLTFFVTTGDTAVTYRAEVWNGERNATSVETGYSAGYVFFQDFEQTTLTADKMELFKEEYMKHDSFNEAGVIKYTRDKLEGETEDPATAIVYIPTTYANFYDYTELDIVVAEEEPEDEPTNSGSSCKASVDPSALLWMSSLLIALVLIAVLVVVILRSFKSRLARNKKTRVGGHFDADARKRQAQKIAEKREAARKKAEEERLAAEEAARKAEEERLAAEEAARKAEEERLAAEEAARKAEEERLAKEAEEQAALEAAKTVEESEETENAEQAQAPETETVSEEAQAEPVAETEEKGE